jgi:phenylacetic acid degradation operon negative regulatory protein
MASPSQHLADVQSLLHDAGVAENVISLKPTRRWRSPARAAFAGRRVLAVNRAKRDVRVVYHSFRPLLPLLKEAAPEELTPERCFQIQLLLIHFYRRVVLKDPLLPEELLPAHWAGKAPDSSASISISVSHRGRWRLSARRAKPPSANCPCPARSTINALVVLQAHKE